LNKDCHTRLRRVSNDKKSMFYPNLRFPKRANRPFFYTNFVSTVDGKVQVLKNTKDYWPIGSKTDHKVLLELRAYADCLIHGRNLASEFGEITIDSLNKSAFKKMRKRLGKNPNLPYYVVTNHPQELSNLGSGVTVIGSNLKQLSNDLHKKGYKNVLVEGGPTLLGSFLKENLIDEIFLTIAPKIFGNEQGSTLSLVEGVLFSARKQSPSKARGLFPKNSVKTLSLLSIKKLGSELYLRYKIR